ncbi:MAG TPA: WecB/TagA/CpsF family glycosyltransferase [Candidatus Limnocylindria bacterium]|nr:WecB/TagA/CpsF family glycosyltransferase [Candidatus Limnocylindria bacterium]
MGFDPVDLAAALAQVERRLDLGRRTFVITANPEFVMLARRAPDVMRIAHDADLVIPDGTGALLASRILGQPLPGRAPGRLLVDGLVPVLERRGLSVFLLGAAPGVAERAASRLAERAPGLRLAGTYAGAHDEDGDTVARVAAAAPDVLLVAFGMPRQERWIARNLARLPSVRLAVGVGGVFDQLAGRATVPPPLVHRAGLEWLWRLVREPQRIRRQRVLPAFVAYVIAQRLLR